MAENGMVHLSSPYSVQETAARLESVLLGAGLRIFCRIDHACEAHKIGMKMRPAEVIIFGNPKGGTPAMVAAPTLAIDLPLKALAWEDGSGKVWLSYNSVEYLQRRHDVPAELMKTLAGPIQFMERAVSADAKQTLSNP